MEKVNQDHSEMVTALAKPGEDIIKDLSPESAHLIHMAIGVAGEAGELLDAIKKHAIYGKPVDMENVVEELGDLEFYMEGLRQGLKIKRHTTLQHNINKLYTRYQSKSYSNEQANARKDKE